MKKKYALPAGILAVLIIIYMAVINLFLPPYLEKAIPLVEKMAAEYLNGQLQIKELSVSGALELKAKQLVLLDAKKQKVAELPELVISVNPLAALWGNSPVKAVSTIELIQPTVYLEMAADETWNLETILKPSETTNDDFQGLVQIKNGLLKVTTADGQWDVGIKGTVDGAADPIFALDLTLAHGEENLLVKGNLAKDGKGVLTLKTEQFSIKDFAKLAERYGQLTKASGAVHKLNLRWENTGTEIKMAGNGYLEELAGTYTYDDIPLALLLNGEVGFHDKAVVAKAVQVQINGEKLELNGELDFADDQNFAAKDFSVALKNLALQNISSQLEAAGVIRGEVTFNGTPKDWAVDGLLQADTLELAGRTFRKVRLPLEMQDKTVIVPAAEARVGEGEIALRAEYNPQTQAFRGLVTTKTVDLEDLLQVGEGSLVTTGEVAVEGQIAEGKVEGTLTANLADVAWQGLELTNVTGTASFTEQAINISRLAGTCNTVGAFSLQGTVSPEKLDLKTELAQIPLAPVLTLANMSGTGAVSGTAKITGTMSNPQAEAQVNITDGEIADQKFLNAAGNLRWLDKKLSLEAVNILMVPVDDLKSGTQQLQGTIDFKGTEPLLDLRIKTNNVRVESLLKLAGITQNLTGNLDNEVTLSGPISQPNAQGHLRLFDGSYEGYLLQDIAGSYEYSGGQLALHKFVIDTLYTSVRVEGKMFADGQLDFAVVADNINLETFKKLETYAHLAGKLVFIGRVTGSLQAPAFDGALHSEKITVNGEVFNDLDFLLTSAGGKYNNFKGKFTQAAGGQYSANLVLDYGNAFLQGTIDAQGGDVHSLLAAAGLPLEVEGALDGKIAINAGGKGSGIQVGGKIDGAVIRGIKYQSADFDLFFNQGIWHLNKLEALEMGGGLMAAQGTVNVKNRQMALEIGANNASARLLTALMENPIEFNGKMNFVAQVAGTMENPTANASLEITQGNMAGTSFDTLYGMFNLKDDVYKIDQLFIQKDVYKVSAYGTLPQDLLRAAGDRRNPQSAMDIRVHLDNANLGILPTLTKWVQWSTGNTDGTVKIAGNLENPLFYGSVKIKNGSIKLKTVETLIEQFDLEVEFQGDRLELANMSAQIGKNGKFVAKGSYALQEATAEPYRLDILADKLDIKSTYFTGLVNGNFEVSQKKNRPHIQGKIRFDDVLLNIPSIPDFGEGNTNIGLDISLELGPKIHLYNKYFYDLWLTGGLTVTGSTRYTMVDGGFAVPRGSITYLRTPFKITKGKVSFPTPGSAMPNVNFEAVTRFGRYNILMNASGEASAMDFKLVSNPPLGQQELFRMLTLKSYNNGVNGSQEGITGEDMQGLVNVGLEMAVFGNVEEIFKRELKLNEFRIYSGPIRTSLGLDNLSNHDDAVIGDDRRQYNILVSKYLTDKFLLGYTTSFDGLEYSLFAQYDMSDRFNFSFSMDEKQKHWYGVEYRITF